MATRKKTSKKASKPRTERKPAAKKPAKKSSKKSAKVTAAGAAEVGKKPTESEAKKAVSKSDGVVRTKAALARAKERSENYAASGLAAQVTETLIDELRALDKPWHQTPEAEQAVAIARLSDRVANAMTQAVSILAAQGHKAVICNLAAVTFKEGVRGTIVVGPGSDMRHELADYATRDCVIVLADPGLFMQGLESVKPDADQPKLI